MKLYAKKVQEKLPLIKQPIDPSQPPDCAIDETVQRVVCAVVNTGEYCATTTEGYAGSARSSPGHVGYAWLFNLPAPLITQLGRDGHEGSH